MIYVDNIFEFDPLIFEDKNPMAKQASKWGTKWCHLWCDTVEEIEQLHLIAKKIGLKRSYFQNRPGFPHYDLIPSKRILAIKAGAKEINLRDWIKERKLINEQRTTNG